LLLAAALVLGSCGSSSLPGGKPEPDAASLPAAADAWSGGEVPGSGPGLTDGAAADGSAASLDGPGGDGQGVASEAGTSPCLPDGSARVDLRFSGGLELAVVQTDDTLCGGSGEMDTVLIHWAVPAPGPEPRTVALSLEIRDVPRGATGAGKRAALTVIAPGTIWASENQCTVDITQNTPAGNGRQKVTGSVHCTTELAATGGQPLTIVRWEFVAAIEYP
jgi:hypothetical protein